MDKKTNGLFSKNKFAKVSMTAGGLVAGVAAGGIIGVAGAGVVGKTVVSVNRRQKMKQQQYQTLVVAFYREGLAKFLEE